MPSPPISLALGRTADPPIPAARQWAAKYRGQAGPMIDLTQAVPGYPPHSTLLERMAHEAGQRANATYGFIDGEVALREAFAENLTQFYQSPLGAADVAITAGCNLAFAMAMTVLSGQRAEILLPTPWYFNHQMAMTMQRITAVPLPCLAENGFIPNPDHAAARITENTRAIVLVSPNNPTGAITPPETIARFAELCRTHALWLILDETYRDFLPASALPPHDVFADPDWRDYVIHLYSFSKAYCVPGHRVGAIAAGPTFRHELMKVLDTMQICAPRAAQAALTWAIPALKDWRRDNRTLMQSRAAAFDRAMAGAPGWEINAIGGYFAYLRTPRAAPEAIETAERLAAEHGLLTLPGPFFGPGQERYIRLAFANVDDDAIAAIPGRLNGF